MLRQQVFDATVRRSNTEQRMRLGAEAGGRIVALGHESITSNLPDEDFFEPVGIGTHFLYGGENRRINHDVVRLNWTLSGSMRAPARRSAWSAWNAPWTSWRKPSAWTPSPCARSTTPSRTRN
ncbi:hypothetical protein GCM10020258_08330 [Sphingomonas yabuuchiae]